ncbi:hypothetical protein KJ782_07145 [Patescibacteria group bacterium]|nr:hypothetical protein [Patescibacteria group bacterium]
MAISEAYKTNFNTVLAAGNNKDLCLLEVYDRLTGAPAVMLCAGFTDENEKVTIIPLARMVDGDPYQLYVTEPEQVTKYICDGDTILHNDAGNATLIEKHNSGNTTEHTEALSVLTHHLGDYDKAWKLAPRFAEEVIAKLNAPWSLSAADIDEWSTR